VHNTFALERLRKAMEAAKEAGKLNSWVRRVVKQLKTIN
jgi:hypothetical protein